tara:strand:+ start:256 stop:1182 length:927 start_codon:yes stop_codon:yes gene_type:complete
MDYLNLLVDKRREFSIYLINDLSSELIKGINSLYVNCKNNKKNHEVLSFFQQILADIPYWNNTIVSSETQRIKKRIPYIEDLITSVFVSNMRLLCSIKNKKKEINVRIPKLDNFIHKCYIHIAEEFWASTYLFNENINKLEIQKNKRQINLIVKSSIEEVIRRSLPIKSILKDYLETNFETETETEFNNSLIDIIEDNKTKNNNDTKNETEKNSEKNVESKNTNQINNNNESILSENCIKNTNENKNFKINDDNIIDDDNIIEDGNSKFNFDEDLFINSLDNNIIDEPNELYNFSENVKVVSIDNEMN